MKIRLLNVPQPFKAKVQEICKKNRMDMIYAGEFENQELYYISYDSVAQTLALLDVMEMIDKFIAGCVGLLMVATAIQQHQVQPQPKFKK